MRRPPARTLLAICALLALGCQSKDGGDPTLPSTDGGSTTPDGGTPDGGGSDGGTPDGGTTDTGDPVTTSTPLNSGMRRLSNTELINSLLSVTGVAPEDATGQLLSDMVDHGFDRVLDSQTISLIHLEAFAGLAEAVAESLIDEQRLDELAGSCSDEIMPPWTRGSTTVVPATALAGSPDWSMAVRDDRLYFLYSDDVTVSGSFSAEAAGRYQFSLPVSVSNRDELPTISLTVGGVVAHEWPDVTGLVDLETDVDVTAAGPVTFEYSFYAGDRWWSEESLEIFDVSIDGPADPGEGLYTTERATCATDLAATLASRAWRRPPTETELARLAGLWASGLESGTETDGLRLVIEGILLSPHFLYLVELGEADPERPGWYQLTDHELAARLSYSLCESPPDDELRAAADAGSLGDADAVENHARRLLTSSCGRTAVSRFHSQWLELDKLDAMARDPVYYPDFTTELGPAMRAETETFFDRMIFEEDVGIEALWSSTTLWTGPETAWIYGLTASAEGTEVTLPEERAGPLNHAALLATTSKFSETSPVLRGVYVLDKLICEPLPSPPSDLDTTPPELNDEMTTRERWEAHSSDPACSGCHQLIDPIGFSLEGFDALGVYRTVENGLPVDSSGGFPSLDIDSLDGGRDLSEALASSDELRTCFAQHWIRYGLARVEDADADAEVLALVADASTTSVYEALVALTGSEAFRHRVVTEETE